MKPDPTQGKGNDEMAPTDRVAHRLLHSWVSSKGLSVRQQGLIKIAVGVPLAVGWYLIQQHLESINELLKHLVPGFPGVLALIGIIELVSGSPISKFTSAWDSLRGWQRLVLGIIIIVLFFVLLWAVILFFLIRSA